MKVFLPAIFGLVPRQMVRAIATFIEFCYIVRRSVIDENDLKKLDQLLIKFHDEREVFRDVGVRADGFNLPRQHSLVHYSNSIRKFGAPNGLCSSITESKHIKAVREPWRRSNRFNALSQMLLTNQRMDKLATSAVLFRANGLLDQSMWAGHLDPQMGNLPAIGAGNDDDDDGGAVDDCRDILGEVKLARDPGVCYTLLVSDQ
jgi:hypothetical protein